MRELAAKFWNQEDIPYGVRILTWATSIRWFGWGIAESLIPVFLFSFAKTYAETGLLNSAYDVAFIISLPIIGMLADRMRSTTLIVIGLSLYVFVGTGYWLAGLTGMVIYIIIARLFNGVGYAMDAVGRETYFRRHTHKGKLATVFGYFDTIANFWWMLASIIGIVLIKFFSIGTLLFLITPTVLVSIAIIMKFRRKEPRETFSKDQKSASYGSMFGEFANWHGNLKLITVMNFFISFSSAVVMFFLPIQVYTEGSGYVPVIIMGIVSTFPSLMGWWLGDVFDRKGIRLFGYGLAGMAALLLGLAFARSYLVQILLGLVFGIIIELLWVGSEKLMTVYTNPEHFGRVDGLMRTIDDMGSLAGPLAVGIVIDAFGTRNAYFFLAALMVVMAGCFVAMMRMSKRKRGKMKS